MAIARSVPQVTALALAFGGASTALAQVSTSANGPYYATPSWDQQITTNRFVVLTNWNSEAVLDRETGLVWQRTPLIGVNLSSWRGAINYCASGSFGGRFGWRLPTQTELVTLFDPTATSGPALPTGHPFIGLPTRQTFPTSTSYPYDANSYVSVGWFTSAFDGRFVIAVATDSGVGKSSPVYSAWCVRGGQGVGPY